MKDWNVTRANMSLRKYARYQTIRQNLSQLNHESLLDYSLEKMAEFEQYKDDKILWDLIFGLFIFLIGMFVGAIFLYLRLLPILFNLIGG